MFSKHARLRSMTRQWLCENVTHDPAMYVGETVVAAGVAIGEPLVIQTQEMQDRRVEVVNRHAPLDGVPTEVVGRAVVHAAANAAAGEPHHEAEGMMLAAIGVLSGRS